MKRLVAIAFLLAALVPSYAQQQLWLHGRGLDVVVPFDVSSFFWYPESEVVKWYDGGGAHTTDLALFKSSVDPLTFYELDLHATSVVGVSNLQIFPNVQCFVNATTTLTNADVRALTNWTSCTIYEHDTSALTNWDMSHCQVVAAMTFLNNSVSTIKMDSLVNASGLLSFQTCDNIYNLAFPSLTNCAGLFCNSDSGLTNIDVPVLQTIGVSTLEMGTAMDSLIRFSAPNLVDCESAVIFESLGAITNISLPLLTNATEVKLDLNTLMYTFDLSSLKTVTVGDLTFFGDSSLTNAVFPSLTGVKLDLQFSSCTALTNFSAPNLVLTNGNGVYFNGCRLAETPVNNLMILADASPGLNASTTIDLGPLGGNNFWPPTGAGSTAYTSLVGKGVTFVHP